MPVAISVNDLHSQLNRTAVAEVVQVESVADVQAAVRRAAVSGRKVSIAGGRHAMGGQQFGTDSLLIDMSRFSKVFSFDQQAGLITVSGGLQWPELIDYLCAQNSPWTIAQKQTGCDKLSIGGAISANVHGRGLTMKPFISDVVSFEMVTAKGELITCSRTENAELFKLASGGYGLFGVIVTATLRLTRRTYLKRVVEIIDCTELLDKLEQRVADGFAYGDFQFSIDDRSDDFLRKGVLSTYLPVELQPSEAAGSVSLSVTQWKELLYLAHQDKAKAFERYSQHYLQTNGQIYSSDRFQLATYIDDYHKELDDRLNAERCGTEIITEIYVPRHKIADFLLSARTCLREHHADLIYGTVRLIEADDESFLAWARENFACTIFNLHTEHTSEGVERSARAFRALIDLAISFGGNYYLTYHRFASREQVDTCYPQFEEFLQRKLAYDPNEMFSSDWYRHYR